jgi:hypothetical protein
MSFELQLIIKDPSYLAVAPLNTPWQVDTQNELDAAEALITSILQTFSLSTGLTTNSYPYTPSGGLGLPEDNPLIDTKGVYLVFTEQQISTQLTTLSNVFLNSIAFLVQNSGGEIVNSFFDAIEIDFSLLPIYTSESGLFSFSDAQSLITNYDNQVNRFITNANDQNYDYFLQDNLSSLRNSLVVLNDVSKLILIQDENIKEVTLIKQQSLTEVIIENGARLANLENIAALNNGLYFSSTSIQAGTTLEIIL